MTKEHSSHRRSKFEIYIDVLQVIKKGTCKPTRVMYDANLSWAPLLKVLKSLLGQGLIEALDAKEVAKDWGMRYDKRTSVLYAITQKGEDVLKYFSEGDNLIDAKG